MSDDRLTGRKAEERDVVDLPEGATSVRIWMSLLAAPTVWMLHFVVVYLAAEWLCRRTSGPDASGGPLLTTVTLVATGVALGLIVVATARTYRRWRIEDHLAALQGPDVLDPSAPRGHDRHLALGGVVLGGIFAIATVMVGLPALWLSPC